MVYKIAGALALQGGSLDDVEALAKLIAQNVATYGVGLEHCHVPGTEAGDNRLALDELELGMHCTADFASLIQLILNPYRNGDSQRTWFCSSEALSSSS